MSKVPPRPGSSDGSASRSWSDAAADASMALRRTAVPAGSTAIAAMASRPEADAAAEMLDIST